MNASIAQKEAELAAERHFASGYYCAESVVLAVAETLQFDGRQLSRAATAFCSGMARTCGPCGALTGAVMSVGLAMGRGRSTDMVGPCYAATQQLVREFVSAFGSTSCSDLLGCDLGTVEGQAMFRDQRLGERCAMYTRAAAGTAARLLAQGRDWPIEALASADTTAVAILLEACKLKATDITPTSAITFFGYRQEGSLAGTIGLERFGPIALLRSLAVAPEYRNRRLASELVRFAEENARANGIEALYLLTTTATEFFVRHGYAPIRRDQAPHAIMETAQFANLCPASSAFMTKRLVRP